MQNILKKDRNKIRKIYKSIFSKYEKLICCEEKEKLSIEKEILKSLREDGINFSPKKKIRKKPKKQKNNNFRIFTKQKEFLKGLSRFLNFLNCFFITKKNFDDLVVCQLSRISDSKDKKIKQIIKKFTKHNYKSENEDIHLKRLISKDFITLLSGYELDYEIISESETNIFGSNLEIIILGLLSFQGDTLWKIYNFIKESNRLKRFKEHLLLQGLYFYLENMKIKNVICITSHSRVSDAIITVASTMKLNLIEYLHGIPSKQEYERIKILRTNGGKYIAFRMIPVNDFCVFSGSKEKRFLNFKLPKNNSNIKVKDKILFCGSTWSSNSNLAFQIRNKILNYQLILLKILKEIQQKSNLELIYCFHPSENRYSDFGKEIDNIGIEISNKSSYHELQNSKYCISLLSGFAWEAKQFGLKTMIIFPCISTYYYPIDLNKISHISESIDIGQIKNDFLNFLDLSNL